MSHPASVIRVELGPRAYDILVGAGVLGEIGAAMVARGLKGPVAVIADANLPAAVLATVEKSLEASQLAHFVLDVPAGEGSKTLENFAKLQSALAAHKVPRSGTVLALGGGVIGDLAGFVAAAYLRGLAFVQVPTTLLAMVDSSVGGKTGVNLPEGKNLVGAFHQPRLVLVDPGLLATLPPREFAAGMAEVIKYGLIRDAALFNRVAMGVKPSAPAVAEIIARCIEIKARVVENDEFETKGERALLNFGHTLGHAIEKATGYTRYLHGEAIALGMRAAAWLSVEHAGLPAADVGRLELALAMNRLPTALDKAVPAETVLAALGNDKKVAADGGNRWVLLHKLGEATSGHVLPAESVARVVNRIYV